MFLSFYVPQYAKLVWRASVVLLNAVKIMLSSFSRMRETGKHAGGGLLQFVLCMFVAVRWLYFMQWHSRNLKQVHVQCPNPENFCA